MPKSKRKVPSGWDKYPTIGEQVRGTPFICFKTPLQTSFGRSWGIPELLDACPKLAMVIDMTDTDRYYSPEELQDLGVGHQKLRVPGGGQAWADSKRSHSGVQQVERRRPGQTELH